MLGVIFDKKKDEVLKILCLGAHSDDIEIGCGGTILRLSKERPNLVVTWVVIGSSGKRTEEARESALALLANVENKTIIIKDFRDGFFPIQDQDGLFPVPVDNGASGNRKRIRLQIRRDFNGNIEIGYQFPGFSFNGA